MPHIERFMFFFALMNNVLNTIAVLEFLECNHHKNLNFFNQKTKTIFFHHKTNHLLLILKL